jgi:ureidoacrylate peracid hydrolase
MLKHLLASFVAMSLLAPLPVMAQSSSSSAPLVELPAQPKNLKPEETALIVVDFQNNFAAEKGEHYPRLEKQYKENKMLEKSVAAVKKARELGIQVIHVTEAYTPDYRELDWGTTGTFHRAQILRQAWKVNTWPVDLYEPLKPGPNDKDIWLPNRIAASAFNSNGLDLILKHKGIRNVAIIGFNTDICVYASVLHAHDLGYRTYALKDLMISFRPEFANQMLEFVYPYWSTVMSSDQFMQMFGKS